MSLSFRNLVLLALLCGIISSHFISSTVHGRYYNHRLKLHQSEEQQVTHHQSTNNGNQWTSQVERAINAISSSIQPSGPSIIATRNLQTILYPRATCQGLKKDQKDPLTKNVQSTRTKVQDFSKDLKDQQVRSNATNAITYLNVLDYMLNRGCGDLNYIWAGPTPYQTNLKTDQAWIFGGYNIDDLQDEYVERVNKYDNLTNCGDRKPFFNGIQCIYCEDPKPIFNISSSECTQCPAGTSYDADSHNCLKTKFRPNRRAGQPRTVLGENQTQQDLNDYYDVDGVDCHQDEPFLIDGKCATCPHDKPYFFLQTKKCIACPPELVLNHSTHRCTAGQPLEPYLIDLFNAVF